MTSPRPGPCERPFGRVGRAIRAQVYTPVAVAAAHPQESVERVLHFTKESLISAPAETLFAFHERKDAFARLQPPWQKTVIVQPPASLAVGTRVILKTKIGPFWQTIEAEHIAYEPGRMFADRMVKGPFASWVHRHIVTPKGARASLLTDSVEYELPLGVLGRVFGGAYAKHELERLFAYRHDVTRATCEERARAEPLSTT